MMKDKTLVDSCNTLAVVEIATVSYYSYDVIQNLDSTRVTFVTIRSSDSFVKGKRVLVKDRPWNLYRTSLFSGINNVSSLP